jgi:hypothetical protein
MNNFDDWIKTQSLETIPKNRNIDLKALTYSLMVFTGIGAAFVVAHGTKASYIIGSIVWVSLITLGAYYRFVILSQKK